MIRGTPPLLPWQPCLLAAIAGMLARVHPVAALVGGGLLCLFPRPAPGRPRTVQLLLAFLAGLGVAALSLPSPPAAVPPWATDGVRHALSGRVVEVQAKHDGRVSCLLDAVRPVNATPGEPALPGRLSLTVDAPPFRPLPGDVLGFTVKVHPTRGFSNPGTFDFAFWRRLQDVFFRAYVRGNTLTRLVANASFPARARERLRRLVHAALAPPKGAAPAIRAGRAMVETLLFGDRSDFAQEDLDLVRRASLAHTLALSGMHVGYVVSVGFGLIWLLGRCRPSLFLRLPRPFLALAVTLPLVVAYCWLGGASPSLYRAVLMFAGVGLLFFCGRHAPPIDLLFLALGALLAIWPLLVFDIRLQLSALAVAGIVLFWPPFATACNRSGLPYRLRRVALWLLGPLWVSLCAEATVLPVVARAFGEVAFNPWINVVWLPVLGGVVLPLALLGLVVLPLWAGPGQTFLLAAAWCCQQLMAGLHWLDVRGWLVSLTVLRPAWPEILGYFGLLACLALIIAGRKRPTAVCLVSCALLLAPTVARDLATSREHVTLTVLDVGQGQAVALDLPGGHRLLLDGGGLPGTFDIGRAVVSPFLTDNRPPRLDAILASHPHADHIKGFGYLLRQYRLGRFWENGGLAGSDLGKPLLATAERRGVPHAALAAGDRLDLGHGLVLEVLHPAPGDDLSGNDGSLVLRLTWNGHGLALVPGDAERPVLHRLADAGTRLDAAVLVLPHHGSASSLSSRFYAAVSPRIAIASCGTIWPYPSVKVVRALDRRGCAIYATNRHGAVTVRFDGPTAAPVVTPTVGNPKKKGTPVPASP